MNNKKNLQNIIKVISWNVENFININILLKDSELLYQLSTHSIILIQEWNDTEGIKLINILNNNFNKFTYVFINKTAIIYDITMFDSKNTKFFNIKLEHQKPSYTEMLYTKGLNKSCIFAILYPYDKNFKPLCVISFHLNSYIPSHHPTFHKIQLRKLITKCLKIINENNIIDYNIIIGGDTNYSVPEKINLKKELLESNIENYTNNNIYLELLPKLKNICNDKCLYIPTQSFECAHEKSLNKKFIYILSNYVIDSRLDIILTNLNINHSEILKVCSISDHSIVMSELIL